MCMWLCHRPLCATSALWHPFPKPTCQLPLFLKIAALEFKDWKPRIFSSFPYDTTSKKLLINSWTIQIIAWLAPLSTLQLPTVCTVHLVFHIACWNQPLNTIPKCFQPPPPPITVDDEHNFKISKMLTPRLTTNTNLQASIPHRWLWAWWRNLLILPSILDMLGISLWLPPAYPANPVLCQNSELQCSSIFWKITHYVQNQLSFLFIQRFPTALSRHWGLASHWQPTFPHRSTLWALLTNEAELFTKLCQRTTRKFFDVVSWEEAKSMPPRCKFDHNSHSGWPDGSPTANLPTPGTELGLLHELFDDMWEMFIWSS